MGGQRSRAAHATRTSLLVAAGVLVIGLVAFGLKTTHWNTDGAPQLNSFSLESRPQTGRQLFDYTGDLDHYEENIGRFLRRMRQRFQIEAVIVTLTELPAGTYLEEVAVKLVDRWRIGGDNEGRGLLLLLVENEKQVKLEVTYELEDVFTDAFTADIQDLQLRPYYLTDDIGTGLAAVMEEIEKRAELEHDGTDGADRIAKLDRELLSGGAGAKRSLDRYEQKADAARVVAPHGRRLGARSPKEAWEILLLKWAGEGADIDVEVYTEMTKMAMGEADRPDPRTVRSLPHWRRADYEVRQDEDHAVIWFGNREGWDNAPFLFCRTATGWKFDIVHQRRLVVMGPSPSWWIARGDYPYVALLPDAPQSSGKDLPLPREDRYSCGEDEEMAAQIRALETARARSSDDIDVLMPLLRLNVITGRRPVHVIPLIKRLKTLRPNHPDVYKYAAIYNVNSFFQYETALADMNVYAKLRPDDVFGRNFIRFLKRQAGRHQR